MSDGTPPVPGPKPTLRGRGPPRPRGGIQRKSKAERDQFAKEEEERQKSRAAELEAASRGGRGGGRVVNRGGRADSTPTQRQGSAGGGGVFGGGGVTVAQSRKKYEGYAELVEGGVRRAGVDSSQGKVEAENTTNAKSSGRAEGTTKGDYSSAGAPVVGEAIETSTDGESEDDSKRDIEDIPHSSSDDDDDDDDDEEDFQTSSVRKGKQEATATTRRASKSKLDLRPVRARRTLGDEEERDRQNDTSSRKKRTSTHKRLDSESQELSSDDRDGDAMEVDTDSAQLLKEQSSSPELRKRALKTKAAVTGKYGRDIKAAANETIEDRTERLNIQRDEESLRNILVRKADPVIQDDDDGDEEEETEPLESGRLFLFQLPPLTPFLTDPSSTDPPAVKTEPLPGANGTTINLESIPDAPPPTAATTANKPVEPDSNDTTSRPAAPKPQLDSLLTATEPLRLPSGVVGKLKVHRSGKVTLDWGGTDMEVKLGSEVDFLQDVVLVTPAGTGDPVGEETADIEAGGEEEEEAPAAAKRDSKGRAYALGHVRQKMVLIPDWAKLYD